MYSYGRAVRMCVDDDQICLALVLAIKKIREGGCLH